MSQIHKVLNGISEFLTKVVSKNWKNIYYINEKKLAYVISRKFCCLDVINGGITGITGSGPYPYAATQLPWAAQVGLASNHRFSSFLRLHSLLHYGKKVQKAQPGVKLRTPALSWLLKIILISISFLQQY